MSSNDRQRRDIRLSTPDDAERVAALSTQLGYPATAEKVRGRLADLLSDSHHAILVAEATDSQVVAWIHVFKRKTIASDGAAEIGGLCVDETCRGGGIGRAIVEKGKKRCQEGARKARKEHEKVSGRFSRRVKILPDTFSSFSSFGQARGKSTSASAYRPSEAG